MTPSRNPFERIALRDFCFVYATYQSPVDAPYVIAAQTLDEASERMWALIDIYGKDLLSVQYQDPEGELHPMLMTFMGAWPIKPVP